MNIPNIREIFAFKLSDETYTIDRSGSKTIEILGASFLASDDKIFGVPNEDYIQREIDWYMSHSTNINDIYEDERDPPKAWKMTGDNHGEINSNYGNLIFADMYFNQYNRALLELFNNPDSRRASMIYTRPSIWVEYSSGGKSDFICTNSVTYYIRDGKMHCVVQMRSNDAWAGYRNDYAWQKYILDKFTESYNLKCAGISYKPEVEVGNIFWQVQNIHMYERNFYLIDYYKRTGNLHISKKDYKTNYPDSKYI